MTSQKVMDKVLKKQRQYALKLNNINQRLVEMDQNIKSKVFLQYRQHAQDMKHGMWKPFPELVAANLGDVQSYGQPPLTFLRQTLALCLCPDLANIVNFPKDVRCRVTVLLNEFPNRSVGSLTDSQGLYSIRKHISEYIRERDDGVQSDPKNIFLYDCCKIVDTMMNLVRDHDDELPTGILVPIPNYPMYTALVDKHGLKRIGYYLHEDRGWEPNIKELRAIVKNAKKICQPKGIVAINPGNPTGQIFSKAIIEDIVGLCADEGLFIIADEVYQQNIYSPDREFCSFKKVKHRLGKPYSDVELISLHSASKGVIGECGFRGGYAEFDGFDEEVKETFLKSAMTTNSGPNIAGQVAMSVFAKPPVRGDPSCETFMRERITLLKRMELKASLLSDRLNAIPGIHVTPMQAGLFAYATIENMPEKAIEMAECRRLDPSLMWAIDLLDRTGIALTPGSSFMQKPGHYYFRATIAPTVAIIEKVIAAIKYFHRKFLKNYT